MSSPVTAPEFLNPTLADWLAGQEDAALDELRFGVIGFDAEGLVKRYNRWESRAAHFAPEAVLGQHVFIELAPCMNNYLIAGRFEDALSAGEALDLIVPYVLTFRMRPTRVRLRLLALPGQALRYILVDRLTVEP